MFKIDLENRTRLHLETLLSIVVIFGILTIAYSIAIHLIE